MATSVSQIKSALHLMMNIILICSVVANYILKGFISYTYYLK
jgi:hypothetical protein